MRILTLALAALFVATASAEDKKVATPLQYKMKSIEGKDVDLSKYKGKVVMFVNVASACGLTPQYKQLQELHDKYAAEGLVIIGVPANEFGAQEPGSNDEIAKFCESKYNVKFPMLAKVVVKGKGITPLYENLTSHSKYGGEIKWNFTKFLVGKDGAVVARFEPRVKPDAPEVITAIEGALKK